MRSTILILLFAALLSPAARAEEKTPEAFARIETELKQERPDAWEIKDIIYHAPAFSADEKQKIAEQIELSALPYKQKIILRNYLGIRRPEKFATLEQKMRQIEEISRRSDKSTCIRYCRCFPFPGTRLTGIIGKSFRLITTSPLSTKTTSEAILPVFPQPAAGEQPCRPKKLPNNSG